MVLVFDADYRRVCDTYRKDDTKWIYEIEHCKYPHTKIGKNRSSHT